MFEYRVGDVVVAAEIPAKHAETRAVLAGRRLTIKAVTYGQLGLYVAPERGVDPEFDRRYGDTGWWVSAEWMLPVTAWRDVYLHRALEILDA